MLSKINISDELTCIFSIVLEIILKGNMEFKLEGEIKNVTQEMDNKHSDLIKMVGDIKSRLDEVNEQMDSFSVDMSSAMKTIKEVKGKQLEMETIIKSNEDTLKRVNEKVHCFSNETEIIRNETVRLDVSSSKLNKRMEFNEKKMSEVNRLLHSNSKKFNDQIKNLENNTQELRGVCLPMPKRVNDTEERLDGVERLLDVINADLYDISKF